MADIVEWPSLARATSAEPLGASVDGLPAPIMRVILRDIPVDLRIGLYPQEKLAPQPVLVSADLFGAMPPTPVSGFAACIDYDRVYRYLTEDWPTRPHVELVEQWLDDLFGFVFADPLVLAARLRLVKTEVFPGSSRAGVELSRHRPAGS